MCRAERRRYALWLATLALLGNRLGGTRAGRAQLRRMLLAGRDRRRSWDCGRGEACGFGPVRTANWRAPVADRGTERHSLRRRYALRSQAVRAREPRLHALLN